MRREKRYKEDLVLPHVQDAHRLGGKADLDMDTSHYKVR